MNTDKLMKVHSSSRNNKELKNVPSFVPFKFLNEEQAEHNHSQSLDKLNGRGGLGVLEVLDIIHKRKWSHRVETQQEVDELNSLIAESKPKEEGEITEKDFCNILGNPERDKYLSIQETHAKKCFSLAQKMCEVKDREIERLKYILEGHHPEGHNVTNRQFFELREVKFALEKLIEDRNKELSQKENEVDELKSALIVSEENGELKKEIERLKGVIELKDL